MLGVAFIENGVSQHRGSPRVGQAGELEVLKI